MNKKIRMRHSLGALAVALTLFMGALPSQGLTLGRYSTEISGSQGFVAALSDSAFLLRINEKGNKEVLTSKWQTGETEQSLAFLLSNADFAEEQMSKGDIAVLLRVFVPESAVGDGAGSLAFTLSSEDGSISYSSQLNYLSPQTPMYGETTVGGWYYSFHSVSETAEPADEAVWPLKGGEISDIPLVLTVNSTVLDCNEIIICVDRID